MNNYIIINIIFMIKKEISAGFEDFLVPELAQTDQEFQNTRQIKCIPRINKASNNRPSERPPLHVTGCDMEHLLGS